MVFSKLLSVPFVTATDRDEFSILAGTMVRHAALVRGCSCKKGSTMSSSPSLLNE
jgi:hypothetical protein